MELGDFLAPVIATLALAASFLLGIMARSGATHRVANVKLAAETLKALRESGMDDPATVEPVRAFLASEASRLPDKRTDAASRSQNRWKTVREYVPAAIGVLVTTLVAVGAVTVFYFAGLGR